MKRIFKILAAMVMIGALCGCNENNTEESTIASESGNFPDGYTVFERKTNAIDSVTMELINVNFDDSSAKYKIDLLGKRKGTCKHCRKSLYISLRQVLYRHCKAY